MRSATKAVCNMSQASKLNPCVRRGHGALTLQLVREQAERVGTHGAVQLEVCPVVVRTMTILCWYSLRLRHGI